MVGGLELTRGEAGSALAGELVPVGAVHGVRPHRLHHDRVSKADADAEEELAEQVSAVVADMIGLQGDDDDEEGED